MRAAARPGRGMGEGARRGAFRSPARRPTGGPVRGPVTSLAPLLLAALAGCELSEVVVAEPEEIVVAEIYLTRKDDGARGTAVLHRTTGFATVALPGVEVIVRGPGGEEAAFEEHAMEACFDLEPPRGLRATCLLLPDAAAEALVREGALLEVEARLPGGAGTITGTTRVPGAFALEVPEAVSGVCRVAPGTAFEMRWSRSAGAWAYLAETAISGLGPILDSLGIEAPSDPVVLVGLSVSEADTTIAFPAGFGVFERFSDNRGLLLTIQDGLPAATEAEVVVAALDRNAVNWIRGGSFHPSGELRTPSLFGAGTGVLGSAVTRAVRIEVPGGGGGGSGGGGPGSPEPCLP